MSVLQPKHTGRYNMQNTCSRGKVRVEVLGKYVACPVDNMSLS